LAAIHTINSPYSLRGWSDLIPGKEGEIEIDRKDNWTELEVKSGGDEMKVKGSCCGCVAGGQDRSRNVLDMSNEKQRP
jgi:hypothetical protein